MPLDLCFVLDCSGSILSREWHTLLSIVVDIVKVIHVGPEGTHIAVVRFDEQALLIFDFVEFNKTSDYEMEIIHKITSIPGPSVGRTFINRGLRLANRRVFREEFGMRPNAKQVLYFCNSVSLSLSPIA